MEQFREQAASATLEQKSRTSEEIVLDEIKKVAENERGEPMTWGATPMVNTADVIDQQRDVKRHLEEYFVGEHVPDYVSPHLAEYIETLNMARTVSRETRNMNSFEFRGKTDLDGTPFEFLEVLDRSVMGSASPAELLLVAKILKIPTIELASLTHPYGDRDRMAHLDTMRSAIENAVTIMGGSSCEGRAMYEVKGSDNPHDPSLMEGLHMTRKRIVGVLQDGTEIMERSSFVLALDKLPDAMSEKIRSIPFENDKFWANKVRRAEKLYELVPQLLEADANETAIPISTTVVAMNPELQETLLTDEAMSARRMKKMAAGRTLI
jgi:hypothetical protein